MRPSNKSGTIRVRYVKVPFWLVLVAAGLIAGVAIIAALVLTGVFLLVLPAILIAGAVYHLARRAWSRPSRRRRTSDHSIIEAEYRVIETRPLDRDQKSP